MWVSRWRSCMYQIYQRFSSETQIINYGWTRIYKSVMITIILKLLFIMFACTFTDLVHLFKST